MPALTALRNRAVDVSPVKAPAMNITLGSAGVLSLLLAKEGEATSWERAEVVRLKPPDPSPSG